MKKRIICSVLVIILCLISCSCSDADYTKRNISYRSTENIKVLDPQLASTSSEITAVINCFEGLTALGEDGKIEPGAAKSYDVLQNGLKYVFHLSSDMLWADGETKLNANDFAFGLTRALLPETKSPFASLLFSIKNAERTYSGKCNSDMLGITVDNDDTLTITLEKADHNFLQSLAHPVAMPCNEAFFESTNGKYGLSTDYLLCNGAYYLKKWNDEDNYLSLSRNDNYIKSPAIPSSITLGYNRQIDNIKEGLLNEDADMGEMTGDLIGSFDEKDFGYEAFYNTNYSLFISPSCSSLSMRKALISDIDVDAITINLPNYDSKTASVLPISAIEGGNNYRQKAGELTLSEYNVKTASKLIDYVKQDSNDEGIDCKKYTLYYPSGDSDVAKCAEMIVQQWQKDLNLFINAAEMDNSEIYDKMASGEICVAVLPVSSANGTAYDAASSISSLGYSEFNKKLQSLGTSIDTFCNNLKNAEQYLIDKSYCLPLFGSPSFCTISKNINGALFNSTGSYVIFKYIKEDD